MHSNLMKIKEKIQRGYTDAAGKELLDFAQASSSRFTNEIIGQLASLKQVLGDERKGTSNTETTQMQKNRITFSLLDLIDEIDEELSTKDNIKSLIKRSSSREKDIVFEGSIEQVIIQQAKNGDNVFEKKEKVIEIGEKAQISAPIFIADSIENSFNALAKSNIDKEIKALLEELLKSINEIDQQLIPENSSSVESLAKDAESLVKEAISPKPRRKWYEVSIEGLKQAALDIGEVATPVLEIVGKLSPLLLG